MDAILTLDFAGWNQPAATDGGALAGELEAGRVLYLPRLRFAFLESERRFFEPRWSDDSAKNISLDSTGALPKGATGAPGELDALGDLMKRFRIQTSALIGGLFPRYRAQLQVAGTSYRPLSLENRPASWRKDDSRLHVDAFPSRPTRGVRILRVFANVNPIGQPRVWRVGEPFENLAKRFLPRISSPLPRLAPLLQALRITKSRRSDYDHFMLRLHDAMKRDLEYQRHSPQTTMPFAANSVWICLSDQVSHAVMSGQFMLEQTMHLPVAALYEPELSPLRTLERLTGRKLV